MLYDLIVSGGGPGGLMAAKTAAGAGLKVLLLEQKNNPARVNRSCLQIFYLQWVVPDGYLETVRAEVSQGKTRFIFPGPGFTVEYDGMLRPYLNAIWISPSDYRVYRFRNKLFGFYYDKEALLDGLLREAEKAGVKILTGSPTIGAENTATGAKIFVRTQSGDETYEAKKVIAADGFTSKIVESLGMNRRRLAFMKMPGGGGGSCVLDNVECDIQGHETSWLSIHVPGLARMGIGLMGETGKFINSNYMETIGKVHRYAGWFRNAKVSKKMGMGAMTVYTPLREPAEGNVLAIGDAAAPIETWIQGAMACGFQAAKATVKELEGKKGYRDYTGWWQKAFYFNSPGYFKRIVTHHLVDEICNAEEIDYAFKLFQDKNVVPTLELARNPEIIRNDNPALYAKITNGLQHTLKQIEPIIASYPPGSDFFEPDAYFRGWRPYIVDQKV